MYEHGLLKIFARGAGGCLLLALALALLLPACAVEGQSNEALRKEVQELKAEVAALKEKVGQLQAGQKEIQDLLKKPAAMAPPLAAPPEPALPAAQPLTVSELIASKDRYLGARVTVKGLMGPVLVHHKSLMLKAPQGMVEVSLARLGDEKLVQRLTSVAHEGPITVTGVVSPSPKGGAKLQITAEAVEF
jgi:outer membrane murein-binding lipoprotein Lpp